MVGRQITLTDGIKSHIESGLEALTKYGLDIISIRAVVDTEERKGQKSVSIEFTISIARRDTVVIKQKDKDLYVAIDLAVDRAAKVLRRYHDKLTDHRKEGLEESTFKQISSNEESESEDEIIPMELELYKPTEIAEALDSLKESDQQFVVFYDLDDKMRVLYKTKDNNKFGLY